MGINWRFAVCAGLLALLGAAGADDQAARSSVEKPFVVAGVARTGSPWFVRHSKGFIKGATDYGMQSIYTLPESVDPEEQLRVIDKYILQGVDALLVIPNNAHKLEAIFKKAQEKGIAVITGSSQDQINADFDIELIDNSAFGALMMDEMMRFVGDKSGTYAIFTTTDSSESATQNIIATAAIMRQRSAYRQLKFVGKYSVSDDRTMAKRKALELLDAHPDLRGILCLGSEGSPGVAAALRERGLKTDQFALLGMATPNVVRKLIKDGYMAEILLYDPALAAHIQTYIARMLLDGRRNEIRQGFEIPGIGKPEIQGNNIIFNIPLIISADNIDEFRF